jgi:chorismate mutase
MKEQVRKRKSVSRRIVCRGIRGATTASGNTEEAILEATRELLYIIIRVNNIRPDDIASVHFTTTVDLNATYPALAARQLGWYDAALLCGHEMEVPGSLGKCIRVLINWNTTRRIDEIIHVYLKEAKSLRPDRETIPESVEHQLEEAFREFEKHSMEYNPDGLRHEEIDD